MSKETALALLGKWEKGAASEETEIIQLLRVWLDCSEEAAEKITEDKTPAKCFSFMRGKARKAKKNSVHGAEAMEWIIEYYGADNPKLTVEGGLAYAFLAGEAQKYKPYEKPANPPAPTDSLAALLEDW